MRKILSWVLLACMILTMIPVSIMANDTQTPSTTEPALKTTPEGAKPLATLADILVTKEEVATFKGDYYLPADLYITLDMIDEYYVEKDPETGVAADLNDINNRVTIVKDANGDVIYYTAEGKIAYDTNPEVSVTKALMDENDQPTGEFEKDANGDVIYYKKPEQATDALSAIAYDTVNGTYKRAYSFAAPLITTDKGYSSEKVDNDGDGKAETTVYFWTDSKDVHAEQPLNIYGAGHSITFEAGIDFTGAGVLFNKMYGTINVYDLSIGTAENPVLFNSGFANIGVVAGGAESHTFTIGEGEAAETMEYDTIVTFDNVETYAKIYEVGRQNNNNIGGLIGKPNNGSGKGKKVEINLLNCVTDVDITGEPKKAGHGCQFGGAIGTWIGDKLVIENTVNYGDMIADIGGADVAGGAAGGFVAISSSANIESEIILKNSANYGTIAHQRVAGGLVGMASCNITIENCTNYGAIYQRDTAKSEHPTAAAGLVGRAQKGTLTLVNCKNETSNITVSSPNPQAVTSGLIGVIDVDKDGNPVPTVSMDGVFSFCDADINLLNGAAIRFDAPTDLKFRAQLSATLTYEKLVELYGEANISVGMVYAKLADYEAAGSFDAIAAENKFTVAGEWVDEAKTTFAASTNAIAAEDYGTKYIASAYVTVKNAEGVEDTIYSFANTETARSVSDVATKALADFMPTKMIIPSAGMYYAFEIEKGVWSKYTKAGCEKLAGYVVAEPAPEAPAPAPEA